MSRKKQRKLPLGDDLGIWDGHLGWAFGIDVKIRKGCVGKAFVIQILRYTPLRYLCFNSVVILEGDQFSSISSVAALAKVRSASSA